jgi:hypothetical protein
MTDLQAAILAEREACARIIVEHIDGNDTTIEDVVASIISILIPATLAAREMITEAIGRADDAFGYSFNMTKLVDGVATHTLTMDGFEPIDFEDRDDGYRVIAERRNRSRADAVLAALRPTPASEEVGEAERIATEIERIATIAVSDSGQRISSHWLLSEARALLVALARP